MKQDDRIPSSRKRGRNRLSKSSGSSVRAVVFGVVQGVGFRPFVYRLAHEFNYQGWVKNVGFGVEIRLESTRHTDFQDFFSAFHQRKPPLAQIESLDIQESSWEGHDTFSIEKTHGGDSFVFISPDISICHNCLKELNTPSDRRYRYPFINCTDCGPRYTIVTSLPYDRIHTTMKDFDLCPDCSREYSDPLDRRYHAQPVACPVCGPHVRLFNARTGRTWKGGISRAAQLIKKGKILAVKGLGGFHLVADAHNRSAIARLRKIKARKTKPLALMARDLSVIRTYAHCGPDETRMLQSPRRPIVLLRKKKSIPGIAPHLEEYGFMLPYTPLHYLLLENIDLIVATSSNQKDSPIVKDESEGLTELCDFILTHNRPINMRADDSLMKMIGEKPLFLRRARGYVPYPQSVPEHLRSRHHILALGAELKDTISIYRSGYVITSQFLGDMDEYQNFGYFQETLKHLKQLFRLEPAVVVSDLHPDFHTTRFAQRTGLPHLQVQHHFAHVLAVLLEHQFPPREKVLGVTFDGYGYGSDGGAWGGEFLIADYASFHRWAHFRNVPLPGGDLAAKQPWRMALAYLNDAYGANIPELKVLARIPPHMRRGVLEMIHKDIRTPHASSCGRLFDAVSYLTGLSPNRVEFEGEAPMRLEAKADMRITQPYPFQLIPMDGESGMKTEPPSLRGKHTSREISFSPTIRAIVEDIREEVPAALISAKFHHTLARTISTLAVKARHEHGVNSVVLTGGCFLNRKLREAVQTLLEKNRIRLLTPKLYSPNDESISLGQTAYALNRLRRTSPGDL